MMDFIWGLIVGANIGLVVAAVLFSIKRPSPPVEEYHDEVRNPFGVA